MARWHGTHHEATPEHSRCFLCLAAAGLCGCRRNIVRAAPPSVTTPPDTEPFPQPTVVTQQPAPASAEPPDVKAPAQPVPAVREQPVPGLPSKPKWLRRKLNLSRSHIQIAPQLSAKNDAVCPFVNLPEKEWGRWGQGLTAWKMEDCVWLEPEPVAQVEFSEWTGANHLRHTNFVGLRVDKDPRKVVRET